MRDLAACDVQQRLKRELEAVLLERLAQAIRQRDVLGDLLAFLAGWAVHLDTVATARFGVLTSDVGLRDDLVSAVTPALVRRDAYAALQVKHTVVLDVLQASHQLEHLDRERFCLVARDVARQYHELVAAEACDE